MRYALYVGGFILFHLVWIWIIIIAGMASA